MARQRLGRGAVTGHYYTAQGLERTLDPDADTWFYDVVDDANGPDYRLDIDSAGGKLKVFINHVVEIDGERLGVVEVVNRVASMLGEISHATTEQSDGIGQVNVAVAELDRMTQHNAALAEESTSAAEQLREQADRLAGLVGSFTLDDARQEYALNDAREESERPLALA